MRGLLRHRDTCLHHRVGWYADCTQFGIAISSASVHLIQTSMQCVRDLRAEDKFKELIGRGGVEDTRLEAKAKAKDTKKIRGQGQGQGQPFRGQTLSRPRTGMLEAKAKDQGHKAQVLSKKKKKKGLHKNFSGDLQKKKKKKKKKRSSQKFFKRSPRKNAFQKIFQPLHKILTFRKIVLSSSRGQANFRGLEASRPRPRPRT